MTKLNLKEIEARANAKCPDYCGGCACHINPPCAHCIEHLFDEDQVRTDVPLLLECVKELVTALKNTEDALGTAIARMDTNLFLLTSDIRKIRYAAQDSLKKWNLE